MIDYPKHLESMWQKAIAPREENAPTFISTFAGGGGSSTGYLMAGYRELLAVEWDDNAVQVLRANYPNLDIYHGDIAKLTVDEVLTRTGLSVGELDLFDGSPPCQGFSTAGKRILDDDRNQLFREYVRLLRGLMPKVFVMENVSGMVKGKMKLVFAEVMRELKASGYKVSCRLLNAKYFHVPQSRERLIFIGVRDDLGIEPSHPRVESKEISTKQAFLNLNNDFSLLPDFNDKYAKLWDKVKEGGNASHVIGKGFNNCVKINSRKPSMTLPKTQTGRGFATITHYSEKRALTINEAARIGSFPDGYVFLGKYQKRWERIGNSVPPLMAEAVGRHIRNEILNRYAQTFGASPYLSN